MERRDPGPAAGRHPGRAQERLGRPHPARRRDRPACGRGSVRPGRLYDIRAAGCARTASDRGDRTGGVEPPARPGGDPMKLTTHLISAPLHTPFITALRTATHADSLLVELSHDSLSGW